MVISLNFQELTVLKMAFRPGPYPRVRELLARGVPLASDQFHATGFVLDVSKRAEEFRCLMVLCRFQASFQANKHRDRSMLPSVLRYQYQLGIHSTSHHYTHRSANTAGCPLFYEYKSKLYVLPYRAGLYNWFSFWV